MPLMPRLQCLWCRCDSYHVVTVDWCVGGERMDKPRKWQLIEIDPGRGILMADMVMVTVLTVCVCVCMCV